MNTNTSLRRAALTVIALMLLGLTSAGTATGATAQASPTVSEIVIDGYDCDTGLLRFHVQVTDLPRVDPNIGNGTLGHYFTASYEAGNDYSIPAELAELFNPQPQIAPYTGRLNLDSVVPSTNPNGPAGASVTSIDLFVGAGNTSETTFTPDCGSFVEQLIAVLIRILEDILAR